VFVSWFTGGTKELEPENTVVLSHSDDGGKTFSALQAMGLPLNDGTRCYVWSIRTNARIDDTGRVSLGVHRPRIMLPRGTKVVRCQHPDGSWSLLKAHPDKTKQPVLIQRLEP
jgi:hypothetical protein